MSKFARILLLLLTTALLAAACQRTLEQPTLTIWLDIDAPMETKAEEGSVPADASEDAIKDLRIWVFLHDPVDDNPADDLAFGYIKPNSSADPLTQYENRYHIIPLPAEIAQNKPAVDIYVIGNPSTVGQGNLNANTTRGTLDGLIMNGELFGIKNNKPKQTTVPSNGLPYTGVAKGLSMTGSYPVMRVDMVKVRKAVSKFRFVFCQLRDEAGPTIKNLNVTGLTLNGVDAQGDFAENGPNISLTEFLFNDSAKAYKVYGYRESPIVLDPPTSIRRYAAPEEYAFNPPTDPALQESYARQYEALINDGINTKKVLTEAGKCYLRETDKQLAGKVTYTYEDGDTTIEKEATFKMHAPGDFARGRSWIVYVYFLRESMQFSVSWTGWEEGREWDLTQTN